MTYFQVRGRLETLWANRERLEMLASKEPVVRRQVENWRFSKIYLGVEGKSTTAQTLYGSLVKVIFRQREAE